MLKITQKYYYYIWLTIGHIMKEFTKIIQINTDRRTLKPDRHTGLQLNK